MMTTTSVQTHHRNTMPYSSTDGLALVLALLNAPTSVARDLLCHIAQTQSDTPRPLVTQLLITGTGLGKPLVIFHREPQV